MGLTRNLVKAKRSKSNYVSYKNMLFYGSVGKTSLMGGLSEVLDKPVLVLSPAGGAERAEQEFSNVISYPVNNLKEITSVYQDVLADFTAIRSLKTIIDKNETDRLEKAKKYYRDDWDEVYEMAKKEELPISAIVLEEISTISNWLQQELEDELEKTYIGEDKSSRGIDWNKFSRKVMDFYTKFLALPVITIFNTGEILPKEKEGLTQKIPDICSGSASRKLTDLIGNVFYSSKTDENEYYVRLTKTKDVFAKDKLLPVKSKELLEPKIDVTNNPKKLWDYIIALDQDVIKKTKKNKEMN